MYRVIGVQIWIMLVAVALSGLTDAAIGAETFGYTSRKPQLWETSRPLFEAEPGRNLYWHDPFLGSWETCRAWPPATNGCAPTWYAKTEMMALWRDNKDSFPFATLGPLGPVALSTSDFRSDFQAGVRATVGKTLGDWYRLELSYFGSYAWDDLVAVRNLDANDAGDTGNFYSPFSGFGNPVGVVGADYNEFASLRIRSRLDNGEFNLRRRMLMRPGSYEASFLIGARYMQISEEFDYQTQSTLPGPFPRTNDVLIDTRNEMIGIQVGVLGQFLFQPRCWIDWETKGGIFQNRASVARGFTVTEAGGQLSSTFGTDQLDRTSFVGEVSVQFNYQFSPAWTFNAGYTAMWVTGVALGANNFETDLGMLAVGPTLLDHSGEVVYHGPSAGLTFAW